MNLFLNAVSTNWKLILFDKNREIISDYNFSILWNESEKLIWIIDDFLKQNNIKYSDLENLIVVAWPGSFTGIRTIVLMINTINFVIKKNITSLNYFDLFTDFPIIKSSSKRDSFLKKDKSSEIEIIKNDDLIKYLSENNIAKVYWENKNLLKLSTEGFNPLNKNWTINSFNHLNNIEIFEKIDYSAIIKKIEFKSEKIINPIYIKKPSIS